MRVDLATSAAGPTNEDFVAALPHGAVLLDGAGISGVEVLCRHGVAWYTRRLGGALLSGLAADDGGDLIALLAAAIAQVTDAHRDTCAVADPSSPSATVAIVRVHDGRVDHLVLGDTVLVLDRIGAPPLVVTDRRETDVSGRHRAALAATVPGTPEHDRARRECIDVLRAGRNQPGGFWVAKDDPRAAAEADTGSVALTDLAGVALLSNGASRIADTYALAGWPDVLRLLTTHGSAELIRRVRAVEACGGPVPDDATVGYCTRLVDPVG